MSVVHRNLLLGADDKPLYVSSGPLLAVTYKKEAKE